MAKRKDNPQVAIGAAEHQHEFVEPASLGFDLDNPRFIDSTKKNEEEVIAELYEQADVNELIQSILSGGYVDFEPLVVLRSGKVVLEGNRRLAALRLISDSKLRNNLKISLPDIPEPKTLPQKVRVLWVDSRDDARSFIGFKHINGAFKWDAMAKAKYASQWLDGGGNIDAISRMLGDSHNTVRRLVNGWYAFQQAKADGFDITQISKKTFAFSHLYTALTRASVREYVGLGDEEVSAPPKRNPIPSDKREEFQQLMSWLYGQEQKGEAAVVLSQNPNLNELSKVLGHPVAKRMLVANRDLKVAVLQVEPPSARFEESLMRSAKGCEELLGLAGSFAYDPTLMKVAEGMLRTVRSLVTVMKESEKKNQDVTE